MGWRHVIWRGAERLWARLPRGLARGTLYYVRENELVRDIGCEFVLRGYRVERTALPAPPAVAQRTVRSERAVARLSDILDAQMGRIVERPFWSTLRELHQRRFDRALAHLEACEDALAGIALACRRTVAISNHPAGAGAEALATRVIEIAESGFSQFAPLYDDDLPLWDKVKTIATHLYGADDIIADKKIRNKFANYQQAGYAHFPVCIAKTQYSFSTDPDLLGAPINHVVPIRDLRLSAGAEFLVVICGDIMTMPGLPQTPAANQIGLGPGGDVTGLF